LAKPPPAAQNQDRGILDHPQRNGVGCGDKGR